MESPLVYGAMSPVFWICRVSGVFPFINKKFNISLFWILFPPSLLGLVTANIYFFFFYIKQFYGFARTMYFGLCFSLYISVVFLVALCFSSGKKYKKLMSAISEVEAFLFQLGVQLRYNTKTIVLDIGLRATVIIMVNICNYNNYSDDVLQLYLRAVGFYLTFWCISCVEMQIVALTSYISCLLKSMTSSLPSPDFEGFLEASVSILEITERVHQLFSMPCFISSSVIFIGITLDLYFVIVTSNYEGSYVKYYAIGRTLARCYQLWRLVSSIKSMSNQMKRLDTRLYTIALEDPTNLISKKRKLILYFSMKRKIEITACGFYPMDLALIHSVVAAVTNYLVILAQFGSTPS